MGVDLTLKSQHLRIQTERDKERRPLLQHHRSTRMYTNMASGSGTPPPSAPPVDDPPPPYPDPNLNLSQLSGSFSRPDTTFEMSSCTTTFKQHFLLSLLFVLAVTGAITMGVFYISKSQTDNGPVPVLPIPGAYGSKCVVFPVDALNVSSVNQSIPDPSLKCDKSSNLQCVENKCSCLPGMYIDLSSSVCLSFAGKSCSNFNNYKPCTSHAICFQEDNILPGICHCEQDYVQVSNGLCLLDYKKSGCTKTQDCNYFKFLKCTEGGLCDCDIRYSQVWDDKKELCITSAGGPCALTKQCTNNSTCSTETQLCTCNPNYKAGRGLCALDYNQECFSDKDCHPSFICTSINSNRLCRCREFEIYRPEDGKCIAMAGKPCYPNKNECDKNSRCDETTGLCLCMPGYSQTRTNLCLANHGVYCEHNGTCNYEAYLSCNEQTRMCECKDGFDYRNGFCVASHANTLYSNSILLGLIVFIVLY